MFPCVILAGGQSLRMNKVNKAFMEINNKNSISRIIEKVLTNNSKIAINANKNIDQFSNFKFEIVQDKFDGNLGPLSGIYTALNWANDLKYKWVLTIPCDLPFFPIDFFLKANNLLNDKSKKFDLISVTSNKKKHHIFSVWNVKLINDLQIKIVNGLRKVDFFASNLKVEYIHYQFKKNETDPFFNINTKIDLQKAQKGMII